MQKFLQNLGGWTKEGDGSVGSALVYWFTRLREGDNYSVLPDGWNLRVLVREVVECAKVLEAQGSQVSEVEDGKAV